MAVSTIKLVGVFCALQAVLIVAQPVKQQPAQLIQHRVHPAGESGWIRAIKEGRTSEYAAKYASHIGKRFGAKRQLMTADDQSNSTDDSNSTTTTTTEPPPVVVEGFQDLNDMLWLGSITIGTPEQGPFNVMFDTGSADLWVLDSSCGNSSKRASKMQKCAKKHLFNSTLSSTYIANGTSFGIQYADGSYASGFEGTDTVRIGNINGSQLSIINTTFAQISDTDDKTLTSAIEGVLGLAFTNVSKNHVTPPFLNAVNQSLVPQPYFTVYLETESDETQVDDAPAGGVFTFGGLDTTNCGDVVDWVPLIDDGLWSVNVTSVSVGNSSVSNKTAYAISDTGTSLIIGQITLVKNIASKVGAKFSRREGAYVLACNATYDPVTFVLNNTEYNLTSAVLTMDIGLGNNNCILAMYPQDLTSYGLSWILGDPFIRQWCNVYDVQNKVLGLAPALPLLQRQQQSGNSSSSAASSSAANSNSAGIS